MSEGIITNEGGREELIEELILPTEVVEGKGEK